uniref:Uncharacterized protein n=1 Tax=Anopheles atroparvus TaxID=41427 RepID=A0AAG5DLT0_ANOAO
TSTASDVLSIPWPHSCSGELCAKCLIIFLSAPVRGTNCWLALFMVRSVWYKFFFFPFRNSINSCKCK